MERYQRKKELAWRTIEGQAFIVNTKDSTLHECNEVATYFWKLLETPASLDDIAANVCDAFEVSPEQARADAKEFLMDLEKKGLIELASELLD